MEQRVLARHTKDFYVGSEDWNDWTVTGQRIRWTKDRQTGTCIEVSQAKATEEVEEIPVEQNTKENRTALVAMQTKYRRLLGQINGLQSRAQFQCCYKFTRCASKAVCPTIGDVKAFNRAVEEAQVTASETSVLATHRTVENNWTS